MAPSGSGKAIRVVYPITHDNGETTYYIAERAAVKKNLLAHISNNLLYECFGVAKSKWDATSQQKTEIEKKKNELLNKASSMELDDILDHEDFLNYLSPAWREHHSREDMVIRKMRNNITKKIPKDFGNSYIASSYVAIGDDRENAYEETKERAIKEPIFISIESDEQEGNEGIEPIKKEEAEKIVIQNEQTEINEVLLEGPGY